MAFRAWSEQLNASYTSIMEFGRAAEQDKESPLLFENWSPRFNKFLMGSAVLYFRCLVPGCLQKVPVGPLKHIIALPLYLCLSAPLILFVACLYFLILIPIVDLIRLLWLMILFSVGLYCLILVSIVDPIRLVWPTLLTATLEQGSLQRNYLRLEQEGEVIHGTVSKRLAALGFSKDTYHLVIKYSTPCGEVFETAPCIMLNGDERNAIIGEHVDLVCIPTEKSSGYPKVLLEKEMKEIEWKPQRGVRLWLLWTIPSSLLHYAIAIAFIHYTRKQNPGAACGTMLLYLILGLFAIIWKLTFFPRYCEFLGNGARFLATRVILEEEDNNHEEDGSPDTSTTVI